MLFKLPGPEIMIYSSTIKKFVKNTVISFNTLANATEKEVN